MKRTAKADNKTRKPAKMVVKRAFEYKNGNVSFNLEIDGWITIYDLTLVLYKDKETGEDKYFISFPQKQDSKGNYWNWVYFNVLQEEQDVIEEQIEYLLEHPEEQSK